MPNLSQAPKQRWTPVPRISPEFQYCIGLGEGWRTARYFPKVGTPKLQIVITNIITACASPSQGFFSQDYNSNEIRVFKEPHGHSSPERSTPAYGQNYTVQDNKKGGGGGGGFSLLRLTAIKQCWTDVLTFWLRHYPHYEQVHSRRVDMTQVDSVLTLSQIPGYGHAVVEYDI